MIKSFTSTSRVKCFIATICIELQLRCRGLFSICLMWFTANCNSNLFVWICGCEEDQMLDSEARWRKSEGLCLCGGSRMNRMLINQQTRKPWLPEKKSLLLSSKLPSSIHCSSRFLAPSPMRHNLDLLAPHLFPPQFCLYPTTASSFSHLSLSVCLLLSHSSEAMRRADVPVN